MEWIRRNSGTAMVGLAALAVLCVVLLVWSIAGSGRGHGSDPAAGGPPLALPTTSPHRPPLEAFPSSARSASAGSGAMSAFSSAGMGGVAAPGTHRGLPAHHVVITAGSDGPLLGVGWWIPTADGARVGQQGKGSADFRHEATAYGDPDYAQLYTADGPESSTVWCTVTVDGKVTDHQVAKGPWGQVFCRG